MSSKYSTEKREGALFHDDVLDETLELVDILPTETYHNRFWVCERSTDAGFDYVIRDENYIRDCFYWGD